MKKQILLLIAVVSLFLISCSANSRANNNKIYGHPWELEYITGPRIAFGGLFPDKKPSILLTEGLKTVTGNSGCNGYATHFTLNGNSISFAEPQLSTMMYCGDGEVVFRKTMKQIDTYRVMDGNLEFLKGEVVMMRFKPAL